MIKKIIGLILILIIFYFSIKAITFSSFFNNLIIGSSKSPIQVGTNYIDQINKAYPNSIPGSNYDSNIKYGTNINYESDILNKKNILSKVTLEKSYGKLILYVENANPNTDLNIWLTNNSEITNKTSYIDFGPLYKSVALKTYVIDMKGGDISLSEYNNILIVDKDYKIHARILLK